MDESPPQKKAGEPGKTQGGPAPPPPARYGPEESGSKFETIGIGIKEKWCLRAFWKQAMSRQRKYGWEAYSIHGMQRMKQIFEVAIDVFLIGADMVIEEEDRIE